MRLEWSSGGHGGARTVVPLTPKEQAPGAFTGRARGPAMWRGESSRRYWELSCSECYRPRLLFKPTWNLLLLWLWPSYLTFCKPVSTAEKWTCFYLLVIRNNNNNGYVWQSPSSPPAVSVVAKPFWEVEVFGESPDCCSVPRHSPQPSTMRLFCVNNTIKTDTRSDARVWPRVGVRGDLTTTEKPPLPESGGRGTLHWREVCWTWNGSLVGVGGMTLTFRVGPHDACFTWHVGFWDT